MRLILSIGLFICIGLSFTKSVKEPTDRYIIDVSGDIDEISTQIQQVMDLSSEQVDIKLILDYNIYRVWITRHNLAKTNIKSSLLNIAGIKNVYDDNPVEYRRTPNDPDYSLQRNLSLIDCEKAWDFSVGGTTASGKEIVVAILDDGFFPDHEDLADNLWTNKGEIAGNGIDDDDNGRIDDFRGLNVRSGNDNHVIKSHGTGVAGIVGARGDNGQGITGVNWDVKLMLISNVGFVSELIEANNYVKNQRQLFNQSNGEQGAFVVASNFSAGFPRLFEDEQPILCQTYNSLGEQGVLSISAPPNRADNIDDIGDLPALCSSPYLIIVTNTSVDNDELYDSAGFGLENVDIAAPGQGSISTRLDNEYDSFGGTSASAPHVSGAISLLYSVACQEFESIVDNSPSEAALDIKKLILDNSDSKSSLEGKTVTGGRLNIFQSMAGLRPFCQTPEVESFSFELNNPVGNSSIQLQLTTPSLTEHQLYIYNVAGQLVYYSPIAPPLFGERFIEINNLKLVPGLHFVTIARRDEAKSKKLLVAY